jgi:hypothetical protein
VHLDYLESVDLENGFSEIINESITVEIVNGFYYLISILFENIPGKFTS